MRTRTTTVATAVILLALTGCSSDNEPAPTKTVTVTTTPALSKAEITQQCVDAVALAIDERPAGFDPEVDTDPQPTECDSLTDSEYLDAYMDGLSQRNKAAQDELRRQIDEAAENDQ